jgi:hypothetical protein
MKQSGRQTIDPLVWLLLLLVASVLGAILYMVLSSITY